MCPLARRRMAQQLTFDDGPSELVPLEAASSTDRARTPCTLDAATLAAQLGGEDVLGSNIEAIKKHTAAMLSEKAEAA